MQRIVADFAVLEQAEQDAKRTFDEIERQLGDLERFLAPLRE